MKKTQKKIDWNEIERQVRDLRTAKLSPEEKLKEARRLADLYVRAAKPIPNYLSALI